MEWEFTPTCNHHQNIHHQGIKLQTWIKFAMWTRAWLIYLMCCHKISLSLNVSLGTKLLAHVKVYQNWNNSDNQMSERTSAAAENPYAHESCHKYVFGNDSSSNNYKYIKNVFSPLTSTSLYPYSSTSGTPKGSHQNIQKEIEYIYAILEPLLWAL